MARVLLDACLPAGLRRSLVGHDVATAHHMGWADLDDADLLVAMSNRFDVLLTADKGIPLQQSRTRSKVAVVVVRCQRIRLEDLLPALPQIEATLERAKPGQTYTIHI